MTKALHKRVARFVAKSGHRPRIVVGKPGLDGHSNGAEVIALSARQAGFDVTYAGIRLSPDEIVQSAIQKNADVIGISVLSGSHLKVVQRLMAQLSRSRAKQRIPVVLGGIVPKGDLAKLRASGVQAVFTPSDYRLADILSRIMNIVEKKEARLAKAS